LGLHKILDSGFCLVGPWFELSLHACKAGALFLEPHLQSIALVILEMGILGTICPTWPQTMTLKISASIGIVGVPCWFGFFETGSHHVAQAALDLEILP
jgi:hypothetical protein